MNLMKSFNRDYMIQNIKKSRSVLAFFLGIIPIISLLAFIILITNAEYEAICLETISIIHFFGIYLIPIMLSVCLFGFVYKKKSVDFIGSMPISRKGIFLSNTIGGILLILAMVLLCALGIYFTSLFTGTVIPFHMISDYILLWSVTYIFVFIISNIAMSVSGNISTQVVVTFLILFFIPFMMDYISGLSGLTYLQPYNNTIYLDGSDLYHLGDRMITTNYTMPYNILHVLNGGFQIWNVISIIKMTILSIVGYFVGYFFYFKRKMEVNETSFQNLKTHNIIKAFTMVPVIFMIIKIVPDPTSSIYISPLLTICVLLGLLIYYFIYDLITKKSITNIKTSFKHFTITLILLFGIGFLFSNVFHESVHTIYVGEEDIEGYQVPIYSNQPFSENNYITIKDKEILSFLTQELKNSNHYEEGDRYMEIRMLVNHTSYRIWNSFTEKFHKQLYEMIESSKNIEIANGLFTSRKTFALGVDLNKLSEVSNYTTNAKLIKEAKNVVKNRTTCEENKKLCIPVSLYAYQNGRIISYSVDSCTNEYLDDYVVSSIQKENKKLYQSLSNQYSSFNIWINHYPDNLKKVNSNSYILEYQSKLFSFIRKHYKDTFSSNKEYISFVISLNNKNYTYYTNKVDEILELLDFDKDGAYDIN